MFKNYGISDSDIKGAMIGYLAKHPKAPRSQVFNYLVRRYGAMDWDDAKAAWDNVKHGKSKS